MTRSGWLAFTLTLGLGALCLPGAGAARPAHDLQPVRLAVQALVNDYALEGASLRLAREGQVLMQESFGGYRGDERVAIASASKWLSALVLGRLVERGVLAWDSRVGTYFPDAPVAARAITLAQLFSHTSGITVDDAGCLSSRLVSLQDCATQILDAPLAYAPGTGFAYGGNSMQVAGAIAERATGLSWDSLFIAEVVEPLGLTATDWTAGTALPGYISNPNPRIGGGARSTLDDYGRVVDMVLAGGRHGATAYLRDDTLAAMAIDRTVGLPVLSSPIAGLGYGYGIGQWVEAKDARGNTLRVSSPGAFGFTPWVDWRHGSNGVLLVRGNGAAMRDDLTAIEQLALWQLDFQRQTQSAKRAAPLRAAPCRRDFSPDASCQGQPKASGLKSLLQEAGASGRTSLPQGRASTLDARRRAL